MRFRGARKVRPRERELSTWPFGRGGAWEEPERGRRRATTFHTPPSRKGGRSTRARRLCSARGALLVAAYVSRTTSIIAVSASWAFTAGASSGFQTNTICVCPFHPSPPLRAPQTGASPPSTRFARC